MSSPKPPAKEKEITLADLANRYASKSKDHKRIIVVVVTPTEKRRSSLIKSITRDGSIAVVAGLATLWLVHYWPVLHP